MKLKQIKTYQAVEMGPRKSLVNYISLDNPEQTKIYPNLKMNIVESIGMVRVQFDGEDKLISLANIAYASPMVEEKSEAKATKAAK